MQKNHNWICQSTLQHFAWTTSANLLRWANNGTSTQVMFYSFIVQRSRNIFFINTFLHLKGSQHLLRHKTHNWSKTQWQKIDVESALLMNVQYCLPAKNWWYTGEALWPYAKPEGWLRRKTLGWNIWERTVLLRWSTSLHWDSLPGGTSQSLWCRETADDNRLLACFLDHTAPFRRQQEKRSFTAEVYFIE